MNNNQQNTKPGALIPSGPRTDHRDDMRERKQRELGAAFNRMGSDSDGEAHSAFDKARALTAEIGMTFDAILKAALETSSLQDINRDLGKQLHDVMRENAKYRSMRLGYKIRGRIIQFSRLFIYAAMLGTPIAIILVLFLTGWVSAVGAAGLLLPLGLYDAARGLMQRDYARIFLGSLILLAGTIGMSVALDNDTPIMHQHLAQQIENMDRDHDLGPKTLYIEYPISHLTYVTTVFGTRDTMTVTLTNNGGNPVPIDITCSKYYENGVVVRRSAATQIYWPEKPDIFHRVPAATYGACDLYAHFSAMR